MLVAECCWPSRPDAEARGHVLGGEVFRVAMKLHADCQRLSEPGSDGQRHGGLHETVAADEETLEQFYGL